MAISSSGATSLLLTVCDAFKSVAFMRPTLSSEFAYVPVGSVSRGLGAAQLNWACAESFFGGRAQCAVAVV